jgi:hypothetical protein
MIIFEKKLDDMKFSKDLIMTTLIALSGASIVHSQDFAYDWGHNIGGAGSETGRDISVDANGNVIVVNDYNATYDADPGAGTTNLIGAGGTDVAISKFDSDGNLIWAQSIAGLSNEIVYAVTTDDAGSVYISGGFASTIDFDNGIGVQTKVASGGYDLFLLKLDSDGNFQWVYTFGTALNEDGRDLEVASNGDIVLSGYFRNTIDFDPGAGTANLTSAGGADAYVLRLTSAGNFVSVYQVGGAFDEDPWAIALDDNDNVYLSGYFQGTADFESGAGTQNLTSAGGNDLFILRINSNNTFGWAKQIGAGGNDLGIAACVDNDGNILVGGYFAGTVDFDPGAGTNSKTSLGSGDLLLVKLDPSGNHIWGVSAGSPANDELFSIAVDSDNNIYSTGYFRNTADFDPSGTTQNLTSSGGVNADQFIWQLDENANLVFANTVGSTNNDHGYTVLIQDDILYSTGYINGTVDLDITTNTSTVTASGTDVNIMKHFICKPINTNDVIVSCGPITWIDGNTYSSDNNTASHTLTNVNGCDSTVHLNLIIKAIDDKNVVASETNVCENGNITVDVQNSQAGVFYTLVDQSTSAILDGPIEGNGGMLTFDGGAITSTTTYEVQAERNRYNSLTFTGNSTTPTYVNVGNQLTHELAGTNTLSVEAWVNTASSAPLQTIVGNYNGPMQFLLRLEPDLTARMWISNGTFNYVNSTTVLVPGTWYHLAATWDGTTISIYVNGVLEATSSCSGTFADIPNNVQIGGGLTNDTEYFDGDITGVRIWNTVRSGIEINDNMDQCIPGNEAGLMAIYNMADGTGSGMLTDESVNGNDGVLMNMDANTSWNYTNMPDVTCAMCYTTMMEMPKVVVSSIIDEAVTPDQSTFCDNGTATISTGTSADGIQYYLRDDSDDSVIDGPIEGDGSSIDFSTGSISTTTTYNVYAESIESSLEFDGVNDFAELSGIDVSGTSFSVEFWGRRNSLGGNDFFMGQGPIGTNTSLHIGFRASGEFTFAFFNNDLNTPVYLDLDWHHWAMTYDATTNARKIYRDGILVASDVATGDYVGTGDILLGDVSVGGSPINGNIDELRIWDGVRTENQINNYINACLDGNESNLVAYYKFDELAGTSTVTDITSNGYDGSLVNLDVNTAWQPGAISCGCAAEMTDVVTITINNSNTGTDVQTACDSYTWIDGNTYTANNNTAQFTVMNIAGCDSVVTLNLTIAGSPIAGSVNNGDGTLSATGTGTYQWIDCGTNTAVAGATSASFIPTANGDYAVVVTSGSCDDTSSCVTYNSVGLNENISQSISVYPNPTQGNLVINLGNGFESGILQITNSIGQVVYVQEIDGIQTLDLNLEQANGIYMVTIFSNGEVVASTRIIKQ